jgi:hypothetical protein
MKKIKLILLFLCLFASVSAQRLETKIEIQRPDYSGTWKLNASKCSGLDSFYEKNSKLDRIMIIEQQLPSIFVTQKIQNGSSNNENYFGEKYTLFSDGRGDKYVSERIGNDTQSVTKWVNNRLVVASYILGKIKPENISSTQEFSLSSDRKTLTQTWRITSHLTLANQEEQRKFDDMLTAILVYDRID